jgi:ribose/xylose/arabinose/galactoside ABC-type transport system permease subunit
MTIPTLPLAFIGWFFAIASFAALAIGVLLLQQLFRTGKIPPEYLQSRIVSDFALLLVWLIGLASGFGLLNGYAWGRTGLEYFCWVLIALTLLSGGTRLASYSRHPQGQALTPRAWVVAVAGVMLVALPLIALCGVSIFTLRSDEVRQQLERAQR